MQKYINPSKKKNPSKRNPKPFQEIITLYITNLKVSIEAQNNHLSEILI
jgi:hypothetical protein